tara:strand:+ start:1595 stop:1789 length:195 start_codon:yes stop_codon:yes gene_type:complete
MPQERESIIDQAVNLAAEMMQRQLEFFDGQIVGPTRPQRTRRLGEQPAQPVIDEIVEMIPLREG